MSILPLRALPLATAALAALALACQARTGGAQRREVAVAVQPGTAGVLPGGKQGFVAQVTGTSDARVSCAFMSGLTWPWVEPLTGATYTLPAKARFDALHGLD
jgi:hypothetical protein